MPCMVRELERGGPFALEDCNFSIMFISVLKMAALPCALMIRAAREVWAQLCPAVLACSCRLTQVHDFAVGPISFCLLPWLPLPFLSALQFLKTAKLDPNPP